MIGFLKLPTVRSFRFVGVLLLLWLSLCGGAQGQTLLPDTLRAESGHRLVLEASGNPYYANGQTVLLAGDTLDLRPGVDIRFGASLGLTCYGTLLVEGTKDSMVVMDRQEGLTLRWMGLMFRQTAGADSTCSYIRYARIRNANTIINSNKPSPEGQKVLEIHRSILTDSSLGVVCLSDGDYKVQNCIFDEVATFAIYSSGRPIEIVNNIFLPHSVNYWNYGVMFFNPSFDIPSLVRYNCFYPGADNQWTNYLAWYATGDQVYTYVTPDSTHIVGDPMLDETFFPLEDSPVIDAGDPTIMDPDLTVADMGVFYASSDPLPCRFLAAPSNRDWVVGYPYLGTVQMQAYPPAAWSMDGAPPGMTLTQIGRTSLALNWPTGSQQTGTWNLTLRGVNEVSGQFERDSLSFTVDFQSNHPPRLVQVAPCDAASCVDETAVIVESLSTGAVASIRLKLQDEDSLRLGAAQQFHIQPRLNGQTLSALRADSLSLDIVLDTTLVILEAIFGDGLTESAIYMEIRPRFTVLAGDVEGVIGSQTGAVFLGGPLRVPSGRQLVIEEGSRLVSSGGSATDWLVEVRGTLDVQGTPDRPVIIQCLATHRRDQDARPPGVLIHREAQVDGLRNMVFEGFSTAVQIEHMEREDPLPITNCVFERCRNSILALGTPVELFNCRFGPPADTLQLGATGVYLASSEGSRVQNNLFLNPEVGVSVVDAQAVVANNSFLLVPLVDPVFNVARWPQIPYLGFGRVHAFNADLDLRNNLFQWRSILYGDYFTEAQLDDYLDGAPRGVFLDQASTVRAGYNWFDSQNGMMLQGDTLLVSMTHLMAYNDSLRLVRDLRAGVDSVRVDLDASFRLFADSPLIDAGDPDPAWNDAFDGSRGDIGWTGGPLMLDDAGYTAVDGLEGPHRDDMPSLPTHFRLREAYPNPFNPTTRMDVELQRGGLLDVRVFDLLGRERAVLAHAELEAGIYQLQLNASGWPSGSYFVRARFAGEECTRPLLLIK